MQINFNGTNFINTRLTQRAFSVWHVTKPVVGEMEMHSVANLETSQTLLATFFPSKKRPNLILFLRIAGTVRGLALPACTHLSLSLSLCLLCSARGREEQRFQLNTDIMLLL